MFTKQLRELEEEGYITRKVYAVVPPKTEHSITYKGRDMLELITIIRNYGLKMIEDYKREEAEKKDNENSV
jgi:DNA-binding HxlR family transcriptional regulator